jgi:hypothetical protein
MYRNFNQSLPLLKLDNQRYQDAKMEGKAPRHATIAISGFLSEDYSERGPWMPLHKYMQESSTALFSLKWEAKT